MWSCVLWQYYLLYKAKKKEKRESAKLKGKSTWRRCLTYAATTKKEIIKTIYLYIYSEQSKYIPQSIIITIQMDKIKPKNQIIINTLKNLHTNFMIHNFMFWPDTWLPIKLREDKNLVQPWRIISSFSSDICSFFHSLLKALK